MTGAAIAITGNRGQCLLVLDCLLHAYAPHIWIDPVEVYGDGFRATVTLQTAHEDMRPLLEAWAEGSWKLDQYLFGGFDG